MEDIFAIQDEIAAAIVSSLKVKLLAEEQAAVKKRHTDNPEAYNHYLKGLYFVSKTNAEALHKALDCFGAAIGMDPAFAPAYVGMAHAYGSLGVLALSAPEGAFPKAKAALRRALELDDELAEAYAETAMIAFYSDWDWTAAEDNLRRAFTLNPGLAIAHAQYAWNCAARGRFEEAVREIKQAQNLDPLMPLYYAFSTGIHSAVGRPEAAIEEYHRAVELDPNMGLAYFHAGVAFARKRMLDQAIPALEKSRELGPYAGWAEGYLGMVHVALGQRDKAERILEGLLEAKGRIYVSSFSIGSLWAALGNLDKAFEYMNKAVEERDSVMPFAHLYAEPAALRSDPRFAQLLKRLNLESGDLPSGLLC